MVNSGTITPDLRRFPNDEPRFVTTVKQGKNGRMPPWGDILNDDDIGALWAYVSSRRTP
jgi:mono/diheme cytochrome c family protein